MTPVRLEPTAPWSPVKHSTTEPLPSQTSLCKIQRLFKAYTSTSLSQSPREWQKYFELSEVRHKQNVTSPKYDVHVQFLQDILLQCMCIQTVPTENRIDMKIKEIHFSLFYFHFNYVVDHHNAIALARDKQY